MGDLTGHEPRHRIGLRRGISISIYATLRPVMAMRLESESGASAGRNTRLADGLSMTLIEVEDADVNDFYWD